jgi:hypothetical protein
VREISRGYYQINTIDNIGACQRNLAHVYQLVLSEEAPKLLNRNRLTAGFTFERKGLLNSEDASTFMNADKGTNEVDAMRSKYSLVPECQCQFDGQKVVR